MIVFNVNTSTFPFHFFLSFDDKCSKRNTCTPRNLDIGTKSAVSSFTFGFFPSSSFFCMSDIPTNTFRMHHALHMLSLAIFKGYRELLAAASDATDLKFNKVAFRVLQLVNYSFFTCPFPTMQF